MAHYNKVISAPPSRAES